MKNVSMRMAEPGPFGETFFEASVFAMVLALFVNRPGGGCVESVFTPALHFFRFCLCVIGVRVYSRPVPARLSGLLHVFGVPAHQFCLFNDLALHCGDHFLVCGARLEIQLFP